MTRIEWAYQGLGGDFSLELPNTHDAAQHHAAILAEWLRLSQPPTGDLVEDGAEFIVLHYCHTQSYSVIHAVSGNDDLMLVYQPPEM